MTRLDNPPYPILLASLPTPNLPHDHRLITKAAFGKLKHIHGTPPLSTRPPTPPLEHAITRPWHEWTEHQGLLGKGFSAPMAPAVFGPFMPGTCIEQRVLGIGRELDPRRALRLPFRELNGERENGRRVVSPAGENHAVPGTV